MTFGHRGDKCEKEAQKTTEELVKVNTSMEEKSEWEIVKRKGKMKMGED